MRGNKKTGFQPVFFMSLLFVSFPFGLFFVPMVCPYGLSLWFVPFLSGLAPLILVYLILSLSFGFAAVPPF